MDRDERMELLHQFVRQLISAGTPALNSIDLLRLGIPEEHEMALVLESFNQAFESSKEIARYLGESLDCCSG
jgi:hypothetical protein